MSVDVKRVQSIFLAALEAPASAERAALLDRECAGDDELRRRVEILLRAHDQPDSFLAQPAVAHAADLAPTLPPENPPPALPPPADLSPTLRENWRPRGDSNTRPTV